MGPERLNVAVADAGPLLHLAEIGCLSLLGLFDTLHVPDAVWSETVTLNRVPQQDVEGVGTIQRHTLLEGEAREVLAGLVRSGLLERMGAGRSALYQLTVETAAQLGVSALGRLLTPAEQEARVLKYVRERGQITNRECQRVCGLTRHQARHLLARLVEADQLKPTGQGRWTRYRPT